jgi:hypothetical protein
MTAAELERGCWRAYKDFYRWGNLWRGAATKAVLGDRVRHLAHAGGWKKFERVWDVLIRSGQVLHALPLLEAALSSFGSRRPARDSRPAYDSWGLSDAGRPSDAGGRSNAEGRSDVEGLSLKGAAG